RYQVVICSPRMTTEIGLGDSYSQRTRSGAVYEKWPVAFSGAARSELSWTWTNLASRVLSFCCSALTRSTSTRSRWSAGAVRGSREGGAAAADRAGIADRTKDR